MVSTGGSRRSGEPKREGFLVRVRAQKRFLFTSSACTESSFLGFGTGPGVGEARNFDSLALAPACQVTSRRIVSCRIMTYPVMSCHVMSCRVMSCHVMSVPTA